MTRDHYSKQRWQPYIATPHYQTTQEHKSEVKIELFVHKVLRMIFFIPRRFWAAAKRGLKKITK